MNLRLKSQSQFYDSYSKHVGLNSELVTLMGPTHSNSRQSKMWDSLSKYYSIFLFFYLNAPHPLTLFLQVLKPKRTITSHKHFQLPRLLSLSKCMGAWVAKLAFISLLDQKVGGGDNVKRDSRSQK